MPFKLVAEMTDGRRYRPGSRISERTNGVSFDLALNVPQQIDVTHLSFTVFNIAQNFFHPARSFAAGRTLSATFVSVEACQGQRMTNHALVFIHHNKSSRTHHGARLKSAISKTFIGHHP